jgi:Kdo2-lipid IVA lauroyltransferase/acyltransferase
MDETAVTEGHDAGAGLPEPFALRWRYRLSALVFFVAYRILRLRRDVIRGNLDRAYPEATAAGRARIAREFMQRQSELFAEIDYSRTLSAEELRRRVRLIDQAGVLSESIGTRAGPILIVAGHQCNFEWMLLRLSLELGPGLIGLYKPMSNARAERYFKSIRTRFGARVLPAKSVTNELGAVRRARALGIIADQVPRTSPERHWTTFLRQPTAFFRGPERLARALRAPIVHVSMRRLRRGFYQIETRPLTVGGEKLPSGAATERYARVLECDIDADPAGWWWSHRRWKIQPPGEASGG